MTLNPRHEVIVYWCDKAVASLESSARELQAGNLDFAVNRIYYAAYYAVSTLLLSRGLSFKKHSGVRAAFHKEFIATGYVAARWGRLYDRWFEDRQEGDYIALVAFEPDYVQEQIAACGEFLDEIRSLLSTTESQ